MAEIDDIIDNQPSEVEKRIKDLSGKVKTAAEERDAERQKREEAEARAAETSRERDFFAQFSDVVATNPAAKDHRDEILAKVKAGYTTEDATFAVLGKAGKLGQSRAEEPTVAGGSAATATPQSGNAQKPIEEWSKDEKRKALESALGFD